VRPDLAVVRAERIELGLQLSDRGRRLLLGEVALERLVEPLDLPAGLGVVGAGVDVADPKAVALELDRAPATTTWSRREHRAVIGKERGLKTVWGRSQINEPTTSAALNTTRASEATRNREWSSSTFKISTSVPSPSDQWVMSDCQHSLGISAANRIQELRGRF
jgi:hypothetical protein